MRTIYLQPSDRIVVQERRAGEIHPHPALVGGISMNEQLAGAGKRPAVRAVFVVSLDGMPARTLDIEDVVHVTHSDWREGRAAFAYYEAPIVTGQCRYCGCTEECACAGGCSWTDIPLYTRCSSARCLARFQAEQHALAEQMTEAAAA